MMDNKNRGDILTSHNIQQKIRVFLAADSMTEVRRLRMLLSHSPDIVVIGYAESASELDAALHLRTDLDVLVTDVTLSGTDICPLILRATMQNTRLNVLCSTDCEKEQTVFQAIQSGATGYILRSSHEDLPTCVRLIHGGGSPVSPTVARSVLRTLFLRARGNAEPVKNELQQALSERELEVLRLLAKGISFAEIGNVLNISPHTVTAHIKKIYRKLQVHSRGEAVYEAQCLGLLREN